jgi:hypothetical protein
MTADMVESWCEVGADEVAAAVASPAVQTTEEMMRLMEDELPQLNAVADLLYRKWMDGLRRDR